jgi:D-2-hydroxyglutarate dehydrogenase
MPTPPARSDWMRKYHGSSRLALRPASTEQAAAALARCSARRLAVVPQGGNTGLVGGGVPVHDEVVLSLGAMNRIISFDEASVCAQHQLQQQKEASLNSYLL